MTARLPAQTATSGDWLLDAAQGGRGHTFRLLRRFGHGWAQTGTVTSADIGFTGGALTPEHVDAAVRALGARRRAA